MAEFDLERFVSMSKAVDLSDIDWVEARQVGLTDDEHRILRFMNDTESHTILYLRDLLAGHTASDPECMEFMACWVYEETHHGRALERFMREAGRPLDKDRFRKVNKTPTFREELTGVMSRFGARLSPHFAAAHMCWGAINELLAAGSYLALARKTRNSALATLLNKLAKDERKHFSFYFHQSEKRLRAGGWFAERLCHLTIKQFWEPVGIGVGEPFTLEHITSYLFSDDRGREELKAIDETIQKLPGMGWFTMVGDWTDAGRERFRKEFPADWARHRAHDHGPLYDASAPRPAAAIA
jgi:hypothetical protein